MAAKFLIVNNGMTEARGHFVETGVAIARAARARGFDVTMGVHARCDGRGVPADLPLLPIFRVDHWGHIVAQSRGIKARLAGLARKLLPTSMFDWARAVSRVSRGLPAKPWAEGGTAIAANTCGTDPDEMLRNALGAIPPDHNEYEHYRMFAADLERFLNRCGAGPGDHVYFPTAYGRDAVAVCSLVSRIASNNSPTFHLEYRHAVLSTAELEREADPFKAFHSRMHRAYFNACRAYPESPRVRFYTDTPDLAADYEAIADFDFGVLPIPFRADLIPPATPRASGAPLRVLFFGDLREEKGFTKLPALVHALRTEGRVQFVIPGALHSEEHNPAMLMALAELESHPAELVARPHRDGFIPAEVYYHLLASADVLLCPYDSRAYRSRSSGVFAEAVAAGKPTVVPAGTWMAREQPPGTGEVYSGTGELFAALRRVCAENEGYRGAAETARERWLERHSPDALLSQLLGNSQPARRAALPLAGVAR